VDVVAWAGLALGGGDALAAWWVVLVVEADVVLDDLELPHPTTAATSKEAAAAVAVRRTTWITPLLGRCYARRVG
jgi:hypothetical protein